MRFSSQGLWGPVIVFALAMATLFFSSAISSGVSIPQEMISPDQQDCLKNLPQNYDENTFQSSRDEGERAVALHYQFKDLLGQEKSFACKIKMDANQTVENSFGLNVCSHVSGEENSPDYICWRDANDGKDNFAGHLKTMSQEKYMSTKGFFPREEGGKNAWVLDYRALVARSSTVLDDCFKSFNRSVRATPENVMAFLLSMPPTNGPIPEVDAATSKWVAGFRLPGSVMIENKGDCDSKAALFCSLLGKFGKRVVIFRSVLQRQGPKDKFKDPVEHAFIGIEQDDPSGLARRFPKHLEEDYIKPGTYTDGFDFGKGLGKARYVPIEPIGRGRTEYGQVALRCGYKDCPAEGCLYVAIPVIDPSPTARPRIALQPPAGSPPSPSRRSPR